MVPHRSESLLPGTTCSDPPAEPRTVIAALRPVAPTRPRGRGSHTHTSERSPSSMLERIQPPQLVHSGAIPALQPRAAGAGARLQRAHDHPLRGARARRPRPRDQGAAALASLPASIASSPPQPRRSRRCPPRPRSPTAISKAFYGQAMAAQEVGGDHFFLTSASRQAARQHARRLGRSAAGDFRQRLARGRREPQAARLRPLPRSSREGARCSASACPVKKGNKVSYVLSASISPERILEDPEAGKPRRGLDCHGRGSQQHHRGTLIRLPRLRGRVRSPRNYGKAPRSTPGFGTRLDSENVPVLRANAYSQQAGWLISTTRARSHRQPCDHAFLGLRRDARRELHAAVGASRLPVRTQDRRPRAPARRRRRRARPR